MASPSYTRSEVDRLTRAEVFGGGNVRCQSPIEVARQDQEHNEPEPDLFVVAHPKTDYFTRHPRGDELLLAIEISDTASRFHRHPAGGNYTQFTRLAEDETVAPDSRTDAVVKVSELLPPTVHR